MRKLTLLLVLSLIVGMLASCGGSGAKDTAYTGEDTNETDSASIVVAHSASDEFVITTDMLNSVLDRVNAEAFSSKTQKSGEVNSGKNVPIYMSVESVINLTSENYRVSWDELRDHVVKVGKEFELLIDELPERCILTHRPVWIQNAVPEISCYVVLDSTKIKDTTNDELVLLLEYLFYELKASNNGFDYDYDRYYEQDMSKLYEKYSDVGSVLLKASFDWYLLNVEAKTLTRIEYFPGYSEVKNAYYDIIDGKMAEEYKEISKE